MSVKISVDSNFDRLAARINRMANFDQGALLDTIGATVESQTRRRISDEKYGPDDQQWPAWLDTYAATRHGGHSLLIGEGHLLDSIQYLVSDGQVEVGSNLIYASTHQFGDEDRNIEPRPFLGLSTANIDELDTVLDDFFNEHMRRTA